jgi:hypothetical protein
MVLLSAQMYFSYSSFFVYDDALRTTAAFQWTENHSRQGFARTTNQVQFATILEFGDADLGVHLGPYEAKREHRRVVEVPLEVTSGRAMILGGPDDLPGRCAALRGGPYYRLIAAQAVGADGLDDREIIDLYFEELSAPLKFSRILVADAALDPPSPLLESVLNTTDRH